MSVKPLIVYHGDCADGFGAAWCFWRHFKDEAEYYKGHYQGALPDVLDRDVYLVDFSYKYDQVKTMLQYAKSVTLIDHHKSALDDLWDLATEGLNMEFCTNDKSGAMLAWEFMQKKLGKKEKLPYMISYIEDRDLWKFALPGSKEISMYLFAQEYDFKVWDKVMKATKRTLQEYIKLGAVLEKKHMKDTREMIRVASRRMTLLEWDVPVLNVPYTMASDAGNLMSVDEPFAVTYYDNERHRCFSLRSNKANPNAVDVSEVASKFGGGGHPNASGFKVDRNHELARI